MAIASNIFFILRWRFFHALNSVLEIHYIIYNFTYTVAICIKSLPIFYLTFQFALKAQHIFQPIQPKSIHILFYLSNETMKPHIWYNAPVSCCAPNQNEYFAFGRGKTLSITPFLLFHMEFNETTTANVCFLHLMSVLYRNTIEVQRIQTNYHRTHSQHYNAADHSNMAPFRILHHTNLSL